MCSSCGRYRSQDECIKKQNNYGHSLEDAMSRTGPPTVISFDNLLKSFGRVHVSVFVACVLRTTVCVCTIGRVGQSKEGRLKPYNPIRQ